MRIILFGFFITFINLISTAHATEATQKIVVSCDDWKGYCNKDGSGWYLDILREIYAAEHIDVELKSEPFVRGLESVKSGSADALLDGYDIPERQKDYAIPTIRIDNEQTVVVFNPTTHYDPQRPIAGRVGYVRGYAYQEHFNSSMKIIELNRPRQGIEMLTHKRIDYFMDDFMEALQAISESHMKQEDFLFGRVDTKPLYVLFTKNQRGKTLADLYDKGIVILYKNGRLKMLGKKYQIPEYSVYYPEIEQPK